MCIRIYILCFNKQTHKQKAMETKEEKRKTKEIKKKERKENCGQYLW